MNKKTTRPFTIKQWSEDDRPREKLLLKGRSALSDAELIAILIATGSKEDSALSLAQKILAIVSNNLAALGKLSTKDFQQIKGIGQAKAISIIAALELGRRRKIEDATTAIKISTSADLFALFEPRLSDLPHEEFWVLLLNRGNKIIDYKKISEGGVAGTVVDPKIIFKYALENLASNIVLCHNHPSGNTMPSFEDKTLTKKIKEGAALLDILVLDHLIIGQKTYYSFADYGEL
jgi:DNA repair protein RadC